ncbi:MAG: hypothetical protein U1E63_12100 [Burkholderiales bacterium]
MRYFSGAPPRVMVFGTAWPGGNFEAHRQDHRDCTGDRLIALVSDVPGTKELKALARRQHARGAGPGGRLLHPGILNIVEAATTASGNKRIYLMRFPSGRRAGRRDRQGRLRRCAKRGT